MTINQAIARADSGKPNVYSDEIKAGWIEELDGTLAVEVLGIAPPTYPPDKWDVPLLALPPYDSLYELYLSARIDFMNQEYQQYNNTRLLFDAAHADYRKWYRREHRPLAGAGYQNVM